MARAPALQAGGQEFDSPQLHHIDNSKTKVIFGLELLIIAHWKIYRWNDNIKYQGKLEKLVAKVLG